MPQSKSIRKVPVRAAQYLIQGLDGWSAVAASIRFFAAHEYHAHSLVVPELVTADAPGASSGSEFDGGYADAAQYAQ